MFGLMVGMGPKFYTAASLSYDLNVPSHRLYPQ